MALFGFAINFTNGCTDYVIASGENEDTAKASVADAAHDLSIESIVHYDAEAILDDQYGGVGLLSRGDMSGSSVDE